MFLLKSSQNDDEREKKYFQARTYIFSLNGPWNTLARYWSHLINTVYFYWFLVIKRFWPMLFFFCVIYLCRAHHFKDNEQPLNSIYNKITKLILLLCRSSWVNHFSLRAGIKMRSSEYTINWGWVTFYQDISSNI